MRFLAPCLLKPHSSSSMTPLLLQVHRPVRLMPLSDMQLIISANVLRSTRMWVASPVSVKVPR